MRTLIILAVGLLTVGCGKSEPLGSGNEYNTGLATTQTTTKANPVKELTAEGVVGSYEAKSRGVNFKLVFLDNKTMEEFLDGENIEIVYKWKLVGKEVHVGFGNWTRHFNIELNGDLTIFGETDAGKWVDFPKADQRTYEKLK